HLGFWHTFGYGVKYFSIAAAVLPFAIKQARAAASWPRSGFGGMTVARTHALKNPFSFGDCLRVASERILCRWRLRMGCVTKCEKGEQGGTNQGERSLHRVRISCLL